MDKDKELKKSEKSDVYAAALELINTALSEVDNLAKSEVYGEDGDEMKVEEVGLQKEDPAEAEAKEEEEEAAEKEAAPAEEKPAEEAPAEEEQAEEESDEDLQRMYDTCKSKMEKRGLLKAEKPEPKEEKLEKTEPEATKAEVKSEPKEDKAFEELKKSYDDLKQSTEGKLSALEKAVSEINETVKKMAAQPAAPRKGVSGYQPLKKSEGSEEEAPLRKTEVIEKLLKKQRDGDSRITPVLINKIETGSLTQREYERVKGLLD